MVLYAALHLPGLGTPAALINDEAYYVPAARAWLTPGALDPNPSHPPLGKLLIAAGMALLGDDPVGWRAAPALFGLLSVLLTYAFGRRLFGDPLAAGLAALLLAVDFLAFVESRMATLDPFVAFFVLASLYFGWRASAASTSRLDAALAGLFLGLGVSTKLSALAALPVLVAFAALRPGCSWARLGRVLGFALGGAAGVYVLAHLPLFWRGAPLSWMLYAGNLQHHYSGDFQHPQMASLLEWAALVQPFWFWWTNDPKTEVITAIAGWGNFVFWWGGLAVLACRWADRTPEDRAVTAAWLGLWLFWLSSFQVRDGAFHLKGGFFYYMLPCVPFMALAVGREAALALRHRRGAWGALFFLGAVAWYSFVFWPILVARPVTYAEMDGLVALTGGVERADWRAWPMLVAALAAGLLLARRALGEGDGSSRG